MLTENGLIYYDKKSGKVLSKPELEDFLSNPKKYSGCEIRCVSQNNLIIENGYVKGKISDHPVADRLAKERLERESKRRKAAMNEVIAKTEVDTVGVDEKTAYQDILKVFAQKNNPRKEDEGTGLQQEVLNVPINNRKLQQKLAKSSVQRNGNISFLRNGKREGIKYRTFFNSVKNFSIAAALALSLANGYQTYTDISKNIEYNEAYQNIRAELQDDAVFVNDNKIAIEDTLDQNGHPIYWIDTEGVARDVLNIPDKEFLGALYMAYDQMGNDRVNGEYHNWDRTIRNIKENVTEENPIALATTQDCDSFDDFLIKNGFVDKETQEPDLEAFEKAGKQAVIDFNKDLLNKEVDMGGIKL